MSVPFRSIVKKAAFLAAPALLLSLGACATPFRANVARFQQMPAPQGQSFAIQAADPRLQGGLEFAQYAALVSQRLTALGYQPAAGGRNASLVVNLDYGVDNGSEKVVTTPGLGYGGWGGGWGPGWGGGWGRGWRGGGLGWGGIGYGRGWGWGWNDPFFGGGWGPDVRSYTVYTSFLDMKISRAGDGQRVFEGRARARSTTDSLPQIVPNLVDAMFTDFPGRSGEELRITIPQDDRRRG